MRLDSSSIVPTPGRIRATVISHSERPQYVGSNFYIDYSLTAGTLRFTTYPQQMSNTPVDAAVKID